MQRENLFSKVLHISGQYLTNNLIAVAGEY